MRFIPGFITTCILIYITTRFIVNLIDIKCDFEFVKKGYDYYNSKAKNFHVCIRKKDVKKTYYIENNVNKQYILKMNSKFWYVFYKIYSSQKQEIGNEYNLKIFYFSEKLSLHYYMQMNASDMSQIKTLFFSEQNKVNFTFI